MQPVIIYTKDVCPYCDRAKNLFRALKVPFEEINLEHDHARRDELSRKFHWRTIPMIVVGGQFVGGFDDVNELHRKGKLRPMLETASAGEAPPSTSAV